MFQSNFPPDKESSSYTVVWNHFKILSKSLTKSDRAAMFHDTAMRAYRLTRVQRTGVEGSGRHPTIRKPAVAKWLSNAKATRIRRSAMSTKLRASTAESL